MPAEIIFDTPAVRQELAASVAAVAPALAAVILATSGITPTLRKANESKLRRATLRGCFFWGRAAADEPPVRQPPRWASAGRRWAGQRFLEPIRIG